jgi:hypothetical protein
MWMWWWTCKKNYLLIFNGPSKVLSIHMKRLPTRIFTWCQQVLLFFTLDLTLAPFQLIFLAPWSISIWFALSLFAFLASCWWIVLLFLDSSGRRTKWPTLGVTRGRLVSHLPYSSGNRRNPPHCKSGLTKFEILSDKYEFTISFQGFEIS